MNAIKEFHTCIFVLVLISHSAIFKLEPSSGGRVVYEDNIVYNNNSSLQPGIPVLQLTSNTEDSLTRFQRIAVTELQRSLKERRKKIIRKKIKIIKLRRPSVKRFRFQLQRKKTESKEKEDKEENKAKRAKKTPLQ